MHPCHRSRLASVFALAIGAAAFIAPPILAQDSAEVARGEKSPVACGLSLDFPGGTAADYIAALRHAEPRANVVVLGDLDRIKMAPVQLQNADVFSALRVLDQLPPEQDGLAVKVRVDNVASSPVSPPVFVVTADIRNRGGATSSSFTTVISMADLLGEDLKPADALTAIDATLGLIQGERAPAEIKFHEQTGLLIARGSPAQVDGIRQVVAQLREREGIIQAKQRLAEATRQSQEHTERAARENSNAAGMAEDLTRQVAEWRTKAELLEKELEHARRRTSALDDELRSTLAKAQALERTVEELQSKVKEPNP